MILSSSWRISQLIQRRNDAKHRLQQITMEINDLKSYGSSIADGGISIGELLRSPTSMYRRSMAYLTAANAYSENAASIQMGELVNTPMYADMMARAGVDEEAQRRYADSMFMSFKRQAAQQFSKYEVSMIQEREKAMELEKQSLQEEVDEIKLQLDNMRKEHSESIQDFFGGNNR